jgi:transcriptional regulator with GAF, ATPase, and Fis domain
MLASWFLSAITGDTSALSSILYMLAIAVIFRPFSEMVQKFVDRFFYREKYEFQRMMLEVSSAITSILDLDLLLERVLDTLIDGLRIEGAAILLWNESRRAFEKVAGGLSPMQPNLPGIGGAKPAMPAALLADTPLAAHLLGDREEIVLRPTSGLGLRVEEQEPKDDSPEGRVAAEMRSYGADIAIPLVFEDKVIGALLLGSKLSRDIYTNEDVRMLRTLGYQAAIAIHNATSYQTIRKLNATLGEKVRKIEDQQQQILVLQKQLVNENRYLKEEIRERYNFREVVGSSTAIKDVLKMVEKVANTQSVVLVRGESGTGKELIARAIHYVSDRRNGPFVKVNCAALSEGVLESELFGHERGAFTGAIRQKVGRFELANGGTVFLDEIGDVPLKTQVRLLRVLQEKEFERVGGNETVQVDVRVIASTHRDLEELIKDRHFREDLFYRLNVISLVIPPLRERKEDIYELAIHFLNKYNREVGKNLRYIDDEAMQLLVNHSWPGNVRELENMIERAVVLGEGECVTVKDLPFGQIARPEAVWSGPGGGSTLPETLDSYERDRLRAAVAEFNGNRSAAARSLGLKRTTFISKLKKYGLV